MLLHSLLHPKISEVLGRAGHTSRVLTIQTGDPGLYANLLITIGLRKP